MEVASRGSAYYAPVHIIRAYSPKMRCKNQMYCLQQPARSVNQAAVGRCTGRTHITKMTYVTPGKRVLCFEVWRGSVTIILIYAGSAENLRKY